MKWEVTFHFILHTSTFSLFTSHFSLMDDQTVRDTNDDLLWRQLKTVPAFRALLRAVESRFYRQLG